MAYETVSRVTKGGVGVGCAGVVGPTPLHRQRRLEIGRTILWFPLFETPAAAALLFSQPTIRSLVLAAIHQAVPRGTGWLRIVLTAASRKRPAAIDNCIYIGSMLARKCRSMFRHIHTFIFTAFCFCCCCNSLPSPAPDICSIFGSGFHIQTILDISNTWLLSKPHFN